MGKFERRLSKLEEHYGVEISQHDDPNPFRWPEAWEAYGLLLMSGGYAAQRRAAELYESGRIEDLKRLFVDCHEPLRPNKRRPTSAQLQWAVDRMPHFLEQWKSEPWWNPAETIRDVLAAIDAGEIVQREIVYGNGEHARYKLEADAGRFSEIGKKLRFLTDCIRRHAKVIGWTSSDESYTGTVSFPRSVHTLGELRQWLFALLEAFEEQSTTSDNLPERSDQ